MPSVVIIPTYNERENIAALLGELHQFLPDLVTIVVDDNSPDGTGNIVDELAARDTRVCPLHRPTKLGLGTAQIAGMKWAMAHHYDPILTMDADFSHAPRFVPAMVAATQRYDLVIGSRYVSGGGTWHCTLLRRALSRGANLFAHTMLGLGARDTTAGFRAYRRAVLESINLDAIVSNGYSFLIELLYQCQKQGWRIGEVPIIFEDRQRGKSKISRQEIYKALGTVVRLRLGTGRLAAPAMRIRTTDDGGRATEGVDSG
ncbi:MAG TPA: polyprenol monophosphomannose synthase [Anaerolineae bacterium]|nr:polyprenol monophosphomannose synthase [Anaerolineae bacterium]